MKKLIREIFFLRKGERRALYFVLLILTVSVVSRMVHSIRSLPEYEADDLFTQHMEAIRRKVDSAMREEGKSEKYAEWYSSGGNAFRRSETGNFGETGRYGKQGRAEGDKRNAGDVPLAPETFDPNTVTYEALVVMNLSAYVSRNIISYRKAGGFFRQPADLAKIYGLSQEDYETLLPYIVIHSPDGPFPAEGPVSGGIHDSAGYNSGYISGYSSQQDPNDRSDHSPGYRSYAGKPGGGWADTLAPLELNRADSVALLALPGIGPWFAGRIIRYRDLLGGYANPAQLLEVYGMDSARYSRIACYLSADTTLIDRIDLNTSSFREVISHPYINREDTYAIFRYRDYIDTIPRLENILKDQVIDRDRFMRMAPYLSVKSRND